MDRISLQNARETQLILSSSVKQTRIGKIRNGLTMLKRKMDWNYLSFILFGSEKLSLGKNVLVFVKFCPCQCRVKGLRVEAVPSKHLKKC